jgi:hypothetical protein
MGKKDQMLCIEDGHCEVYDWRPYLDVFKQIFRGGGERAMRLVLLSLEFVSSLVYHGDTAMGQQ